MKEIGLNKGMESWTESQEIAIAYEGLGKMLAGGGGLGDQLAGAEGELEGCLFVFLKKSVPGREY
jgi:hypothetical protein